MSEAVVQLPHLRKEGGDQRIQPYQEGTERVKVCHALSLTEREKSLQKRKATTSVASASKRLKVAEGEHSIEHYAQLVRKDPVFRFCLLNVCMHMVAKCNVNSM